MDTIVEAFRAGGAGMYILLALGLVATPGALLTMILTAMAQEKNKKTLIVVGVLNLIMVFVVFGVGMIAYSMGMSAVEQAIAASSPEHIEKMRALGTQYAQYPAQFALVVATLPLLAGVAALVRQSGLR